MLKMYYLPGACSTVPHVALVWSGLEFTAHAMTREETKSPAYLAKNPRGQVPLLEEDDWTLTENVAIIDYINDLAPQAGIFASEDPHIKAKARQWLAFANSDLHPAFGLVFNPQSASDDKAVQKDIQSRAVDKVVSLFGQVDAQLQHQDFLVGDIISIGDVYVYITLRWAKGCGIDLSRYNNLEPFSQRVAANPGVEKVLKAQGLN